MRRSSLLLALALPLALGACQSAYYSTMEKFGVHKREILVDRVEQGRDDQAEAQEQFQTTLEAFQELTGFDGGDLEKVYNRLKDEYEESADKAEAVRDRIDSIESVASALFSEWEEEIEQMSSASLKKQSKELRADTQERYGQLIGKMRAAEARMEPVLAAFNDQVLFLKHNLNAKAISSLKDTALEIESGVADLIREMQASIAEADSFIASMES